MLITNLSNIISIISKTTKFAKRHHSFFGYENCQHDEIRVCFDLTYSFVYISAALCLCFCSFHYSAQASFLVPFFYYRFLQLRYTSRRNPYSRWVFFVFSSFNVHLSRILEAYCVFLEK